MLFQESSRSWSFTYSRMRLIIICRTLSQISVYTSATKSNNKRPIIPCSNRHVNTPQIMIPITMALPISMSPNVRIEINFISFPPVITFIKICKIIIYNISHFDWKSKYSEDLVEINMLVERWFVRYGRNKHRSLLTSLCFPGRTSGASAAGRQHKQARHRIFPRITETVHLQLVICGALFEYLCEVLVQWALSLKMSCGATLLWCISRKIALCRDADLGAAHLWYFSQGSVEDLFKIYGELLKIQLKSHVN